MTPESLVPLLIGAGGLITAAVTVYRARADKTAVEMGTQTGLMEAAVATAKGLAEASAMVVEPLRAELTLARERIAVVEEHAKNSEEHARACAQKLDALSAKFASLEATVIKHNGEVS